MEGGSALSRALGTAVHTLLEELARLRKISNGMRPAPLVARFEPRIAAQVASRRRGPVSFRPRASRPRRFSLRSTPRMIPSARGFSRPTPARPARLAGPESSPAACARCAWTASSTAGPTPGSEESDCWWIIDYKTAHADNIDPAKALPGLRALFAPQIEAYAKIMRNLHGTEARIFAGLYYPRMLLLDWWKL
jgi:ATP-dependent helicase/nuclease subunit A